MQRIKALRVGGEDADIVWADRLFRDQRALGMVNHDTKIIYLDAGLRGNKMRTFKVLLHEGLHLIEEFMNEDFSEDTINRIAQGMAALLVESKIVNLEELEFGHKGTDKAAIE